MGLPGVQMKNSSKMGSPAPQMRLFSEFASQVAMQSPQNAAAPMEHQE